MSFALNSRTISLISFALIQLAIEFGTSLYVSQPPGRGPDFCESKHLTAAFNDQKHQILLYYNDWIWVYDPNQNKVSAPFGRSADELYDLRSIAYISDVPECPDSGETSICGQMSRLNSLLIMLYKQHNKPFAGAYQVKRISKQEVIPLYQTLQPQTELPFGLKSRGNMFSLEETFWPKELFAKNEEIDKSSIILVYNPIEFEVILLVTGRPDGQLCFYSLKSESHSGSAPKWKCQSIGTNRRLIGAFVKSKNTYVLAVDEKGNRVFTMNSAHELIDTNIDVQNYLGCGLNKRLFNADIDTDDDNSDQQTDDKSSQSGSKWGKGLMIIGFVALLITAVVGITFFIVTRKDSTEVCKSEKDTKSAVNRLNTARDNAKARQLAKKKSNVKSEEVPKAMDKKGREVSDDQIGALDSKVNWDIVVATPSEASFD